MVQLDLRKGCKKARSHGLTCPIDKQCGNSACGADKANQHPSAPSPGDPRSGRAGRSAKEEETYEKAVESAECLRLEKIDDPATEVVVTDDADIEQNRTCTHEKKGQERRFDM